jgi:hypothetical protein
MPRISDDDRNGVPAVVTRDGVHLEQPTTKIREKTTT